MKIKNLNFSDDALVFSPMAGVGDFSLRALARSFGADFSYTEMVSCKGLIYESAKTNDLLFTLPEEKSLGIQLFGGDEKDFARVAKMPQLEKFDLIDINFGCPAPKIVRNAEGSALLEFPDKIFNIVKATVENTSKPVTAKIRLGIDDDTINAVEVAKAIEAAGASAITVHGRTQKQHYTGKVNYEGIALVKQSVSIPVIGNGDVVDQASYKKMLETKVDAVALARAAMGSPWVFGIIKGQNPNYNLLDVMTRHYEGLKQIYPDEFLAKYLRKHFLWYLKPLGSRELNEKVVKMTDVKEILFEIENFLMK